VLKGVSLLPRAQRAHVDEQEKPVDSLLVDEIFINMYFKDIPTLPTSQVYQKIQRVLKI